MSGYVRIHRSLIGHPAFRNDAEAMAFAWLVARAAWRATRVRYKQRGICLERGQLAISVREFAFAMDRDKAWIERLLKRLKSETMAETVTETGVTVVTICNYDIYQSDATASETPRETAGETRARQTQDTEQGSEEGKKENREARARPCFLKGIGLPKEIPVEPWAAFVRMRKAKDKGFTEDAAKGAVRKLLKMAGEGFCPAKLLWKSVDHGWKGFFEHDDCRATVTSAPIDWTKRAEFYDGIGKKAEADECRRKAMPIGRIANDILKETRTA